VLLPARPRRDHDRRHGAAEARGRQRRAARRSAGIAIRCPSPRLAGPG